MSIEAINVQTQPVQSAVEIKPMVQAAVKPVAKAEAVVKPEAKPVPDLHSADIDRNPGFSTDEIKVKITELNQILADRNQNVAFSTDAGTGHKVVTVSNLTTGELIRQMPSVDALKAMNNIDHMMGLIFSERTQSSH